MSGYDIVRMVLASVLIGVGAVVVTVCAAVAALAFGAGVHWAMTGGQILHDPELAFLLGVFGAAVGVMMTFVGGAVAGKV